MICKKGALRNFAKFTGKHQCQSLFYNKVAGLRSDFRPWYKCFPVNFANFLRTPFLLNTSCGFFCNDTKITFILIATMECIISSRLLMFYYIKIGTKSWHYQKFPCSFILISIFTFSIFAFFRLFYKIIWIIRLFLSLVFTFTCTICMFYEPAKICSDLCNKYLQMIHSNNRFKQFLSSNWLLAEYLLVHSHTVYSVQMRENTDQKNPNTGTFHAVSGALNHLLNWVIFKSKKSFIYFPNFFFQILAAY